MVRNESILGYARLLRIIAHPTRLMILDGLTHGMKCVNDIQDLLDVPQPNVSQHLAVLKESGLVVCHKDGVSRCYHLAKPGLVQDLFAWISHDYPTVKRAEFEMCRVERMGRSSSQAKPKRKSSRRASHLA